jgi:hypothetical protein
MRGPVRTALLAALAAVASAAPAAAWDYPGHRIVGAIADLVLQQHYTEAHKRVSALLERKDANGEVVEKRSLSQAAVFADCAKPRNKDFCGRPSSDEEIKYADRNKQHAKFHFTDVPLQQRKYIAGSAGTDDIDVVQMIAYAVAQLRGNKPAAKEGVDLTDTEAVWLLAHLVGDIHQPLHVGAKYFDASCEKTVDPNVVGKPPKFGIGTTVAETRGGGLIDLAAPPPAVPWAKNLHFYWDGAAVVRAMQTAGFAGSEQEFAKLLATAPPRGWETRGPPETWATQWANEIMPLAVEAHGRLQIRKASKPAPVSGAANCKWETTIYPAYDVWAGQHARTQIAKAGFRLAALFKAIFEP